MSKIYLHHYPASTFSEKIRALFGYLDLEWHSVETSVIMPRPLLMPLSGGYRRIPVAQIGADVYCDTKIIARAPRNAFGWRAAAVALRLLTATEHSLTTSPYNPGRGDS